ncbi:MAG: hypothetical protein KGH89_03725 [Thaumarchaeota archaeon]|nr:hypothetical protein [Nitrososphaerota archaeon]MDE1867224.1 hypothetical protein [Nitrososphaerota archaeon]
MKEIFLIGILLFGVPSSYATSFAIIHLDTIGSGIREGTNVTFSGTLTTPDGTTPLPNRTIFIEDSTTYPRPNIILALTTTDSDGKFLTFWKAVPKDNGQQFHFYAKFLGGKIFGYTKSETYESTIELSNQSSTEVVPSKTIPMWFKDASKLWHDVKIRNWDYAYGVQNLIDDGVVKSNDTSDSMSDIPSWFRGNAGWLSDGKISDYEFVNALEYLLNNQPQKIT